MTTAGINAFAPETIDQLKQLTKKHPLDCFGAPVFCKSCTCRVGRGATQRCGRWNTAIAESCPFRDILKPSEG